MTTVMKISNHIISLLDRILAYRDYESDLQIFDEMPIDQKEEIFMETFKRRFKVFWNNSSRQGLFKMFAVEENEESEVLKGNGFGIASNEKDKFHAMLNFAFNSYSNEFIVSSHVTVVADKDTSEVYTNCLNKELEELKMSIEDIYVYSEKDFLKDFFNTLHAHRLTMVTGTEAVIMYEIYGNAVESFPCFGRLSYSDQIAVMHRCYMRARTRSRGSHDIYAFAQESFWQFDEEGLIYEVIAYNPIAGGVKEYHSIYERRINRSNPDRPSEIWQLNYLVYATYEYTTKIGERLHISFHPSELWSLLHGRRMEVAV